MPTKSQLEKMKVTELKVLIRDMKEKLDNPEGLTLSGNKQALVDRILAFQKKSKSKAAKKSVKTKAKKTKPKSQKSKVGKSGKKKKAS